MIEIHDGFKSTYEQKDALKRNGFKWEGRCWMKESMLELEVRHWEEWSRFRGLRMKAISEISERGSHYRAEFFAHNPLMFGDKYVCAYCGRRLTKKQVQVDHIIPVEMAKRRADIRDKIHSYGWESINDPANLCAACSRCNKSKSCRGGLWIIRGRLGKQKWWQYFMVVSRIMAAVCVGFAIGAGSPFLGFLAGAIMSLLFLYLW